MSNCDCSTCSRQDVCNKAFICNDCNCSICSRQEICDKAFIGPCPLKESVTKCDCSEKRNFCSIERNLNE